MRWQACIGRLMRQIVANMCEERPLSFYPLHNAQRIFHCGMRRMRLVPQGVQKKNVQTFQLMKRRLRDFAVICEIGRASKAEAIDLRVAMNQPHWFEARPEKFHRSINRLSLQLWQTAI